MSLPHILLGLLHGSPRTGYDLARALREEIEPSWSAAFSQIYPALARLRRLGWVRLRTLGPRRGPARRLHRVTAAGRRELRRWLEEAPPPSRRNDPGLARIALLDVLALAERRRALTAAENSLAAEIARLEALPSPGGFRSFARRGAIRQLDALRRFLESGGAAPVPIASARGRREARKKR